MIGRVQERERLLTAAASEYSEFVAVYGRRRVGKTFLIRETFGYKFSFQHTGLANAGEKAQLMEFRESLKEQGYPECKALHNWYEAFHALEEALKRSGEEKKVVFIDEMPWLDTPRSMFVSALEHFWNGWASARKDILLIICGSATSWIIDKVLKNHGGLHNRVTMRLPLRPFSLQECEAYAQWRGLSLSRMDLAECYMVLGGIPFYWSCLKSGLSLSQNLDSMLFDTEGELAGEFSELYASLFRMGSEHIQLVTALGKRKCGMSRQELLQATGMCSCGKLSKMLEELEQCGFLRKYNILGNKTKGAVYQLVDNFTLFYFQYMKENSSHDRHFWTSSLNSPRHNAWLGLAFERLCLQHLEQIKKALGISGVVCNAYAWRSLPEKTGEEGAQIDLLIDRNDRLINLCEMKFSYVCFEIDKFCAESLRRKLAVFLEKTHTRKSVHLTMITANGIEKNAYSGMIQSQITLDDLFQPV